MYVHMYVNKLQCKYVLTCICKVHVDLYMYVYMYIHVQ